MVARVLRWTSLPGVFDARTITVNAHKLDISKASGKGCGQICAGSAADIQDPTRTSLLDNASNKLETLDDAVAVLKHVCKPSTTMRS